MKLINNYHSFVFLEGAILFAFLGGGSSVAFSFFLHAFPLS